MRQTSASVETADRGPALLVIDVQRGHDDPSLGTRNNPDAERRIARLLDAWRRSGAPIVHVRHASRSPDGLFKRGTAAFEFKDDAAPLPDEPVLEKDVNSAFIGTDLEDRLRAEGVETLVIAGLTTDHCCSTTARMAGNLGFETWFVADATATFPRVAPDGSEVDAETMHRAELASLDGEFAEVIDADEAIARLERNARAHHRRLA